VYAELREETGYEVGELHRIAEFSSSSGMTSETVHGYVATNCVKVSDILTLDMDEYIERVVVPFFEFDQLVASEMRRGSIIEPKMLAMMYAWKQGIV
jgi:ADP-ribose pyrophosphatase